MEEGRDKTNRIHLMRIFQLDLFARSSPRSGDMVGHGYPLLSGRILLKNWAGGVDI